VRVARETVPWHGPGMAEKPSPDELAGLAKTPGWSLEHGDAPKPATGTLEDVAKLAHTRHSEGKPPGIIRQIETSLELDMLQLEQLWLSLGLPH
jgi:hypothetical protein